MTLIDMILRMLCSLPLDLELELIEYDQTKRLSVKDDEQTSMKCLLIQWGFLSVGYPV